MTSATLTPISRETQEISDATQCSTLPRSPMELTEEDAGILEDIAANVGGSEDDPLRWIGEDAAFLRGIACAIRFNLAA